MSQEAYKTFGESITENGILLVDEDMVRVGPVKKGVKMYRVPFTRLAEELKKKIVANIVMLGAFTALSNTVSVEAMKKSILATVPKGTEELNMNAFQKGYDYAIKLRDK